MSDKTIEDLVLLELKEFGPRTLDVLEERLGPSYLDKMLDAGVGRRVALKRALRALQDRGEVIRDKTTVPKHWRLPARGPWRAQAKDVFDVKTGEWVPTFRTQDPFKKIAARIYDDASNIAKGKDDASTYDDVLARWAGWIHEAGAPEQAERGTTSSLGVQDPDAIAQNFAEDVMKAQAARAALLRSGYGFGDAAKEPDDVAARMTETIGKMEATAASQQVIDAKRREMARDVCRVRRQHVTNIDQAMQFAENWIVTAAQHAANEEYWRERAMRAEAAAKVPTEDPKRKRAALGFIRDEQGRVLMVWNHRYNGWALPGGKVEPGETLYEALRRELEEEICIVPEQPCVCIHEGKGNVDPSVDVHVFSVTVYQGIIDQGEPSGPIMWADRAALLVGPFSDFYVDMFAKLDRRAKGPPPP